MCRTGRTGSTYMYLLLRIYYLYERAAHYHGTKELASCPFHVSLFHAGFLSRILASMEAAESNFGVKKDSTFSGKWPTHYLSCNHRSSIVSTQNRIREQAKPFRNKETFYHCEWKKQIKLEKEGGTD